MRSVALEILLDVTENGAYANIALRKALGQAPLEPRDRAFVTELVNETIRNLQRIDAVVNHFSSVHTDKMKPYIRNLLRMAVCQLRVMQTPPHAAVYESVELAKKNGFFKLSGFVNGVLRAIVRAVHLPEVKAGDWAAQYSIPPRLATDLMRWLGEGDAEKFAQNSHAVPAVTVRVNTIRVSADALAAQLRDAGVEVEPLGDDFLSLKNTGDISALAAFKSGLFFVMDAGAMAVVAALRLQRGQSLLDMCAAPGGKSFAAACIMADEGEITALDLHPHRVALMETARKRLGFASITTRAGDATKNATGNAVGNAAPAQYDAVLLDAPCSGLGTLRKRPEIKYKYEGIDAELLNTQRALLTAAAGSVKPEGTLVYATCTVAQPENGDMVRWFCGAFPQFALEEETQLLPGTHNDGFYIARFRLGR